MRTVIWTIGLLGTGTIGVWLAAIQLSTVIPKEAKPSKPSGQASISSLTGRGYIEPVTEVRRLSFKIGGVIHECLVRVGDDVRKGDPLLKLDSSIPEFELKVVLKKRSVMEAERARVLRGVNDFRIRAAEKDVDYWKQQVDLNEREFGRSQSLFGKGVIARSEFDRVRTAFDNAKSRLEGSQAEVKHLQENVLEEDKQVASAKVVMADAEIELHRARIRDHVLTAPFDGKVLEILRREGESISELTHEPVIVLADLGRLRVRAEFDERHVYRLQKGMTARVYGRNLGEQSYRGEVTTVKEMMGEKTVFVRSADERKDLDIIQVFIDMGPDFRFPVGLRVDVAIDLPPPTDSPRE